MRNILLVGLGGFIGSVLRYALSGFAQRLGSATVFPIGTLSVNVIGCFAIGLLGGWAENLPALSPSVRLLLLVGLLGGFTTFSSFGYETMALLRDGQTPAALASVSLHLVAGLGAVWLGYGLSALN